MDVRVAGYLEQARSFTATGDLAQAEGFERAARDAAERLGSPSAEVAAILEQVADRLTRAGDVIAADDRFEPGDEGVGWR